MTKEQLMQKLSTAVDDAMRQRLYGTVEIEFRAGMATFLRTQKQEKLDNPETEHRGNATYYR